MATELAPEKPLLGQKMPWPGSRLENRPLSRRMHREKCRLLVRSASGAPVFANGAVTAAMSYSFGQAARRSAGFTSTSTRQGDFTAEERAARFEEALTTLGEEGLIPDGHKVGFDNRFVAARRGENGSIISRQFFDSYDDLLSFTNDNAGYTHLLGENPIGIPRSTIYAGAANARSGSVFGWGAERTGTFRMTGEEILKFTVMHEVGHATGLRQEFRADAYALKKLGF